MYDKLRLIGFDFVLDNAPQFVVPVFGVSLGANRKFTQDIDEDHKISHFVETDCSAEFHQFEIELDRGVGEDAIYCFYSGEESLDDLAIGTYEEVAGILQGAFIIPIKDNPGSLQKPAMLLEIFEFLGETQSKHYFDCIKKYNQTLTRKYGHTVADGWLQSQFILPKVREQYVLNCQTDGLPCSPKDIVGAQVVGEKLYVWSSSNAATNHEANNGSLGLSNDRAYTEKLSKILAGMQPEQVKEIIFRPLVKKAIADEKVINLKKAATFGAVEDSLISGLEDFGSNPLKMINFLIDASEVNFIPPSAMLLMSSFFKKMQGLGVGVGLRLPQGGRGTKVRMAFRTHRWPDSLKRATGKNFSEIVVRSDHKYFGEHKSTPPDQSSPIQTTGIYSLKPVDLGVEEMDGKSDWLWFSRDFGRLERSTPDLFSADENNEEGSRRIKWFQGVQEYLATLSPSNGANFVEVAVETQKLASSSQRSNPGKKFQITVWDDGLPIWDRFKRFSKERGAEEVIQNLAQQAPKFLLEKDGVESELLGIPDLAESKRLGRAEQMILGAYFGTRKGADHSSLMPRGIKHPAQPFPGESAIFYSGELSLKLSHLQSEEGPLVRAKVRLKQDRDLVMGGNFAIFVLSI